MLRAFSDEMEAVIALAFFIPLLIGTGGNTGTQIATTLVRAIATGQVRFRDVPAVLVKELSTGALVGFTMAVAAVIRAWTLNVGPQVTVTVAVTVAAIVVWSSLVAAILPPLLKQLRIDPAIVSGPLIATIVDGTGADHLLHDRAPDPDAAAGPLTCSARRLRSAGWPGSAQPASDFPAQCKSLQASITRSVIPASAFLR